MKQYLPVFCRCTIFTQRVLTLYSICFMNIPVAIIKHNNIITYAYIYIFVSHSIFVYICLHKYYIHTHTTNTGSNTLCLFRDIESTSAVRHILSPLVDASSQVAETRLSIGRSWSSWWFGCIFLYISGVVSWVFGVRRLQLVFVLLLRISHIYEIVANAPIVESYRIICVNNFKKIKQIQISFTHRFTHHAIQHSWGDLCVYMCVWRWEILCVCETVCVFVVRLDEFCWPVVSFTWPNRRLYGTLTVVRSKQSCWLWERDRVKISVFRIRISFSGQTQLSPLRIYHYRIEYIQST